MQQDHLQSRCAMEHIRVARDNPIFNFLATRRLTWWPELGIGFYPVECGIEPYDDGYFDRFAAQAATDLGRKLMQARVDFVDKFLDYQNTRLVDIGIGSGAFIEARGNDMVGGPVTYGFDVCPKAVKWLEERRAFWNVNNNLRIPAISLWDVFEHLPDFVSLISKVDEWVFVSIPIFNDADHILHSKHYRKDEHMWYFTEEGLCLVFKEMGFRCIDMNWMETLLGRENIGTFAFKRAGR